MFGQEVTLLSLLVLAVHGLGIANAAHAVMHVRSPRGAVAWSIGLVTFPWLAVPLYWIFGRNRFLGYAEAIRTAYEQHRRRIDKAYDGLLEHRAQLSERFAPVAQLGEQLATLPFLTGNTAQLLIDGRQTYDAMLTAISRAERYVLLQSYIVEADRSGERFKQALIERAKAGVRVYVLYDEIGSNHLPRSYSDDLRRHGVEVSAFHSTKGWKNRLQINFRNHTKILVVDGQVACVGGLNIGDEYLGEGKNPQLRPWRDTHLRLTGPAVQCLQLIFLRDWYWATGESPPVEWRVHAEQKSGAAALVLRTGPADSLPACTLFFVDLIQQARERLWLASPYFVPPEPVLLALQLAAMRGVDVRILLPDHPDHLLVYLCAFSFYDDLARTDIKLYRYQKGFMHQKVVLVDREIAGVGTANLDNRSFTLNFEVMNYIVDSDFVKSVEAMLTTDLAVCRQVDYQEYRRKPLWFRLAVRISRLLAPVL
ncbi:cardiolipin synthase [Gloeobacter morelensis]|uniref:Cardiolipin synthase n=1 Tax=Gloeobacter morelensis MG652769 TaxID=2781736 RepID=A0ABY3PRN4_9CYAN|nr:cardiolipin synthase [Gloeobacter morelensis]UFP96097.1 cardiolipin synthase [Gloeobacter morelensis MG652769]